MIQDPSKKALFEVRLDIGVWNTGEEGDSSANVYRIYDAPQTADFIETFSGFAEFKTQTEDYMVFQVGMDRYLTINRLPLYPLSDINSLARVLKARNILRAA